MKKNKDVCLLFRFVQERSTEDQLEQGMYQILFFFDENGHIDFSEIRKALPEGINPTRNLEFKTKEVLLQFAQKFIEVCQYENIHLLSANDFNIGIESCHNIEAFRDIFKDYGNSLANQTKSEKSLFSKLF